MAESENPPLLSVEEAAEQAILFSRVLCPFYDSEPESDSNSDSESDSDSDLSTLSDDDDYHSLPSSPMASLAPESDPFLLDSSLDFFDSCPMETDVSFFDEFESDRNSDLVDWVSTERMSRYSLELVSEQDADVDLDSEQSNPGSDELPDLTALDSDDLQVSRFEVESDLEEPFNADEVISTYGHLELEADADPDPYWADTVEFSSVQEMDVIEPEVTSARPASPDTSFLLDNLPDDLFDRLPEPDPNPNPDPEPDWDAVSTDSSSVPDLEEMVRNLEWEVLLAVNNIYETDAEITFFRQFLEQDSAVKGGPPASKSVVESLPSITVDESKGDLQCAVCKESVLVGESVKRLPCSHDYHASCILPWLGIRNTCPLCRFELPTDDPNYESWRARQENQIVLNNLENQVSEEEITDEEEEDEQIVEEKNSPRKKQKTGKPKDNEIVIFKEFCTTVTDLVKASTAELVKSRQRLQIPASEIWAYLEELQLEENVHYAAYVYLIKHPAELGAFLGCPSHSRKTILLKMLHDAKDA